MIQSIRALFRRWKEFIFPTPKPISSLHQLNNSLKKFQDSIDEVDKLLHETLLSWEKTFQVEIRHTRGVYKFDLSNPSTKQELERKQLHARQLADLVIKRWIKKKSLIPLSKAADNSFYELLEYFMGPDPKMVKQQAAASQSQSYKVEIDPRQIEAWKRMRSIYFPQKENDEISQ